MSAGNIKSIESDNSRTGSTLGEKITFPTLCRAESNDSDFALLTLLVDYDFNSLAIGFSLLLNAILVAWVVQSFVEVGILRSHQENQFLSENRKEVGPLVGKLLDLVVGSEL